MPVKWGIQPAKWAIWWRILYKALAFRVDLFYFMHIILYF